MTRVPNSTKESLYTKLPVEIEFKKGDTEPVPQVGDKVNLKPENRLPKILLVGPCGCHTNGFPEEGWRDNDCGPHFYKEGRPAYTGSLYFHRRNNDRTYKWGCDGTLYRSGVGEIASMLTVVDLCPECGVAGEWVNMALRCPACWKIF